MNYAKVNYTAMKKFSMRLTRQKGTNLSLNVQGKIMISWWYTNKESRRSFPFAKKKKKKKCLMERMKEQKRKEGMKYGWK